MKEPPPTQETVTDRLRSWLHPKPDANEGTELPTTLPTTNSPTTSTTHSHHGSNVGEKNITFATPDSNGATHAHGNGHAVDIASLSGTTPHPDTSAEGTGSVVSGTGDEKKHIIAMRFALTTKKILFSSWLNVILVFVPVGIAVEAAHASPIIIFVMNAIAIVPLAGLLSYATESVAKRMGDTVGALMNVTFGNSVELIIFIIALAKNEIRIVQASLLGSILANLLLILGLAFFIGGLRFREQIYNSTVTQMSACLLSLSVMSLLLPTAFHAAFNDENQAKADTAVVKVSRGTSVILLLVYGLYLVFQLNSHAYLYQSTPQHIIDEESAPGPVALWMETSSDDSSSSSSSDDSDDSNGTAAKIKRAIKRGGRRRRKSSVSTANTFDRANLSRNTFYEETGGPSTHADGDIEDNSTPLHSNSRSRHNSISEKQEKSSRKERKERKRQKHAEKKERKRAKKALREQAEIEDAEAKEPMGDYEPRRVDFAVADTEIQAPIPKRPFLKSIRPALPKTLSQSVFTQPPPSASPHPVATPGPVPRIRYGIRRTNSLPLRLDTPAGAESAAAPNQLIHASSSIPIHPHTEKVEEDEDDISRTTAVILLLISTGLVAVCAEFMVASINDVTTHTALGETFVGLIILPIVGNAAEHVTAVTVATKNKVDLAIGVAVGSSIQIALFVTPFIVLLGWMMDKPMSLYFTLFETVCLFVSAFIVNFLVLDGRSNYLEGALLCAAYVIIAVAAFFYPALGDQSLLGGNTAAGN
ncbi:calcium/proton exchanger [Pseudogymnoascus sp. 23342-1-I1]|nr:calcium/proton exchanger [Pseudogymnoascus sp. 23342-1-I1]